MVLCGVVQKLMEKRRKRFSHINDYLPLQPEYFYDKADDLETRLQLLEKIFYAETLDILEIS